MNSDKNIELRDSFPLFRSLPVGDLEELKPLISWFTPNEGNSLFQQGAPGLGVYLLLKGKVEQYHLTSQGKTMLFELSGPGKIVGAEVLFNKENHVSTAEVTSEEAEVGFLERNNFFSFMEERPSLLFAFTRHLSTKTMAHKLKLVEAAYSGSKQRISRLILAGEDSDLTLTRNRLSQLSGVCYKTTIQILSELEERGLIEAHDHAIKVKEEDGLKNLANDFPLDLEEEGLL